MNTDGLAELLMEILSPQLETGQYGELDEKRFREALTTGPEMSQEEQSLLLLSPVARSDYKRISQEIRMELATRLEAQGVELELLPLAAATTADKVVMHGNGFDVTLYRQEGLGVPWVILVQVGTVCLRSLNPMTVLRLVDSGGLEWLRGRPDVNGEISATWDDRETDLLARSRRFSLILEPI